MQRLGIWELLLKAQCWIIFSAKQNHLICNDYTGVIHSSIVVHGCCRPKQALVLMFYVYVYVVCFHWCKNCQFRARFQYNGWTLHWQHDIITRWGKRNVYSALLSEYDVHTWCLIILCLWVFLPHRMYRVKDVAHCYRCSVVCVCQSVGHNHQLC